MGDYLLFVSVLLFIVIITNAVCLILGLCIGRGIASGDKIAIPNPVRKIQESRDDKARRKEWEAIETMLHNIDIYDGTGSGQRDIPG